MPDFTPTSDAITADSVPRSGRSRWRSASLLVLLAVGCGVALWFNVLHYRVFPKRWGTVVPGVVFRSGQVSRFLIVPTLRQHGIRHIICMTSPDAKDEDQQAELAAVEQLGIEHVFLPLNGRGIGKVEHFTQAVTRLARNAREGEPVLVHCHAGTQRTGGVIAAYRLLIEQRSPQFVLDELRRYGWNPRRDQVLVDFVNAHLKDAATELVAAGCLEQIPQPLPVLR